MLDLTAYLKRHGVSRDQVGHALAQRLTFEAYTMSEDGVSLLTSRHVTSVFAGSLVEGLGNDRSDIDVYCLMDDSALVPTDFPGTLMLPLSSTVTVDVELHDWDVIHARLDRLTSYPANEVRDFRETVRFSPGDLKLLHALSLGEHLPMAADDCINQTAVNELRILQDRIDRRSLARLIFDRASAYLHAYLTDGFGALETGDMESAGFLFGVLYWQLVAAVLAVAGETNPAEKWRPRLLKRLMTDEDCFAEATLNHPGLAAYIAAGPPSQALGLTTLRERYRQLAAYIHIYLPLGTHVFTSNLPTQACSLAWDTATLDEISDGQKQLPRLHPELMTRHTPDGVQLSRAGHVSTHVLNLTGFQFLAAFTGDLTYSLAIAHLSGTLDLPVSVVRDQLMMMTRFLEQNSYIDPLGPVGPS